jgi:hypothetical protein
VLDRAGSPCRERQNVHVEAAITINGGRFALATTPLRTAVSFAQQLNTFAPAITTVPGIAMIAVSSGSGLARY